MKKIKNVSNIEVINSLKKSIKKNDKALDYITREKNRLQDLLKYNEKDIVSKDILEDVLYIEFTLKYLGNQYHEALRLRGIK